jgi:hypothetical protein
MWNTVNERRGSAMFVKNVLIPVLIISAACFWGGMQFERARWKSKENQKKRLPVRLLPMPKKFNWKVG